MQAARTVSLRTLVAHTPLGLKVVVEGDQSREVRGAHTIEIEGAGAWLEPGWLMLTTGMRFVGVADAGPAQSALVAELVERDVAALLFGIGVHFDSVPPGLVAAAREQGLTLLTIEADVPFLAIEKFVNQSLMSSDASILKQNLQLQNDLIDTLSDDEPVNALVRRLGILLKGTAILYEESGRVVASTGDGPAMLIWSEIQSASSAQFRVRVGRWHVIARPTVLRGVGYWIALGSRRENVLDELAEPILDATQRLLGAIRGVRSLSTAQAVAEAAQILRTLRSGMTPATASRTWDRMRAFRFQRERAVRTFVTAAVRPDATRVPGVRGLDPADQALSLAQSYGLPLIFDVDPETGDLVGIVGNEAGADEWCAAMAEHFHIGLSEPFVELHESRDQFRDAERALTVARRRAAYRIQGRPVRTSGERGMVLRFEDVDVVNWLLSSRSSEAVTAKVHQQFAGLLEREELVETLVAYFLAGMDAKRTADAMFLHANSVRYRLRRIEEIIQAPLSSAAVIANLYVAFHDRIVVGD